MFDKITHLITPCCINHKLHHITEQQLDTPLSTVLYTLGDTTLIDVLNWLITRFPAGAITIVTTHKDHALYDCLAHRLNQIYDAPTSRYMIQSLTIYTPTPQEGDLIIDPLPDLPRTHYPTTRPHSIPFTMCIESHKGTAFLQGDFPLQSTNPQQSLHTMTYSNSPTHITNLRQLLRFLEV